MVGRLRLYATPRLNRLTNQPAGADYRQVLDALARRDQLRMLVDGMTAANDLGLTTAVPACVVIHTDTRRRAIHLDNLTIAFKQTAPSKLYWSGHPARVDARRRAGSPGATGRSHAHGRPRPQGPNSLATTAPSVAAIRSSTVTNAAFLEVIAAKHNEGCDRIALPKPKAFGRLALCPR